MKKSRILAEVSERKAAEEAGATGGIAQLAAVPAC